MTAALYTGKMALAPYSSGASFGLRKFSRTGNADQLVFNTTENSIDQADYQSPGGGLDASVSRITANGGTISLKSISAENLALATWGSTSVLNTTAITGEAHKIYAGKLIPAARLINTAVAPVLKKGATTIATTDYTVSKSGLLIASTIGTAGVAEGDAVTLDYTPAASVDVQAMISSAPLLSLQHEGVNEVDGKYFKLEVWKIKLGAPKNIQFIGDNFLSLEMDFKILRDDTILTGSQYYKLEFES